MAVKITHIKTFSSDPILIDFYKDAAAVFEKKITALDQALPHGREERKAAIHKELDKLEALLNDLDPEFVKILQRSRKSYNYYTLKRIKTSWSILFSRCLLKASPIEAFC